jgi:hypothetical protein
VLRVPCLLLLLLLGSLPACFVVVVDANGNNQNPFLDGGEDAGLVLREPQVRPNSLAVLTPMDYISAPH